MPHLLFFVGLLLASVAWALMEIQIEGRSGWASALPTWRFENAWTRRLLGSRQITGYHVWIQVVVAVFAHLPYLLVPLRPTWGVELRILAFLVFFWILEDFLWFVFNPAFGVRRFRRDEIWWHAGAWWGFMPRDYWIFTPIGIALYIASWMVR